MYGGKLFLARYPLKTNNNIINLEVIKEILENDKINTSLIDDYRYYNKNKKKGEKITKNHILYTRELSSPL